MYGAAGEGNQWAVSFRLGRLIFHWAKIVVTEFCPVELQIMKLQGREEWNFWTGHFIGKTVSPTSGKSRWQEVFPPAVDLEWGTSQPKQCLINGH